MEEDKKEKRKIKVNKSGDEGEDEIEVKSTKKKPREKGNKKIVLLIFLAMVAFSLFFKLWPMITDFRSGKVELPIQNNVERMENGSIWESL